MISTTRFAHFGRLLFHEAKSGAANERILLVSGQTAQDGKAGTVAKSRAFRHDVVLHLRRHDHALPISAAKREIFILFA